MNLKVYQVRITVQKDAVRGWYWLMQPVARWMDAHAEKLRVRRRVLYDKITESQALQWIAEDIAAYLIREPHQSLFTIICDDAVEDDLWPECAWLRRMCPPYIRRPRAIMGFKKFASGVPFQEKLLDQLNTIPQLTVEETVKTYPWERIENYQKTVRIQGSAPDLRG